MATTTIRWACVSRIVELARDHELLRTDDCSVETVWPGDTAPAECIYLADLDGELSVPVSRGADDRVVYDDKFTMTWALDVRPNGKDPDEVMARADEMIGALQDVIATQSQLSRLDGVVSARLGQQNGPLGIEVRGVGLVVVAQLHVDVHSRLSSCGAPMTVYAPDDYAHVTVLEGPAAKGEEFDVDDEVGEALVLQGWGTERAKAPRAKAPRAKAPRAKAPRAKASTPPETTDPDASVVAPTEEN